MEQRIKELEKEVAELKSQNKMLSLMSDAVSSSINAIGITDLQGKLIFVNDSCVKMWGYNNNNELLGRFLPEFWDGDGIQNTIKELQESGRTSGEDIGKKKDGSLFNVQFSASVFKDETGNLAYMFGSFIDITSRKKVEEGLRESEEQLQTLLQSIHVGIVVHGSDTKIIECNKASQELLGLSEDQMLGKEASDLAWKFYNEDGSNMPLEDYPVTQVITKKNVLKNFITGIYRPNESNIIWVLVNAVPEFGSDGDIKRVIVTFMDITDRKIAENRLQNIFNTSIPICITNADYQIVLSNDAYKDIFDQSELSESPVKCYESRPGPACQTDACPMKRVLGGEKEVLCEPTKVNADGSKQYFIVTARPFLNNKGEADGIVECFQDITDRKNTEIERDNLIEELKKALSEIKILRGILPICSFCKQIRNDEGYYEQIEGYISKHSSVDFSHTVCPECLKKHYPEYSG